MGRKKSSKGLFNYVNYDRQNRNYMYKNFHKSESYKTNFSNSNFNYTSFRGAKMKFCSFYGSTFHWTEFIGSTLTGSNFKNATFKNTIFQSANLKRADFEGATFEDVIFLNVKLDGVKNLKIYEQGIEVLDEMPIVNITPILKNKIEELRVNDFIRKSRVLHLKRGKLNTLNIKILLHHFSKQELLEGLSILKEKIDKPFYTLSFLIKHIEKEINS